MSDAFHLFERFGVELEYMIVDQARLDVLPVTDQVIHRVCGSYESELVRGPLSWSNELVLHVIELKTGGPAPTLAGLAPVFQEHVREINTLLEPLGGRLMPGSAHPWMDPHRETRLWPHEYDVVYASFDRVFNCRGHGWSNLQATHLNLPFADDDEFGRLHAAIRLVLPILPALAASSPILDGRPTGLADSRLEAYRLNARRIPSVSGQVIPEPVFTIADYHERILNPLYRDVAPHDPEGILQHEWLNARGAIARFQRNTIEIRVLDIQECPLADLAILALIVGTLQALVREQWCSYAEQQAWDVEPLAQLFRAAIRDGDQTVLDDPRYLRMFGLTGRQRCTAAELWTHLLEGALPPAWRAEFESPLRIITTRGCLARRILAALDGNHDRARLAAVYGQLCHCLAAGQLFLPE